jgi:hypothetical protein
MARMSCWSLTSIQHYIQENMELYLHSLFIFMMWSQATQNWQINCCDNEKLPIVSLWPHVHFNWTIACNSVYNGLHKERMHMCSTTYNKESYKMKYWVHSVVSLPIKWAIQYFTHSITTFSFPFATKLIFSQPHRLTRLYPLRHGSNKTAKQCVHHYMQ